MKRGTANSRWRFWIFGGRSWIPAIAAKPGTPFLLRLLKRFASAKFQSSRLRIYWSLSGRIRAWYGWRPCRMCSTTVIILRIRWVILCFTFAAIATKKDSRSRITLVLHCNSPISGRMCEKTMLAIVFIFPRKTCGALKWMRARLPGEYLRRSFVSSCGTKSSMPGGRWSKGSR